MEYAIYIGLFLPLIGFLALLITSSWISRTQTNWIGCGTVLIAFICFSSLLYIYTQNSMKPITLTLFNWISLPET